MKTKVISMFWQFKEYKIQVFLLKCSEATFEAKSHLIFNSASEQGVEFFRAKTFRERSQTRTRTRIHTHTHIQTNYLNHWPTLNIASPDLHSALQNWHDGVIWDSTPPLIASDEGMVDRWSHAQKTQVWVSQGEGSWIGRVCRWAMMGRYQRGGGQLFLICTKFTIISIKSFMKLFILVQIWRLSAVDC